MADDENQRGVNRKLKSVVYYDSDSDYWDYYDSDSGDEDKGGDLPTYLLSLGKLSLGPKKKLLIIPVGGFLCHRVFKYRKKIKFRVPPNRTPDFSTGTFNVYERPHAEEFVKFCLERFEVGIWSSSNERNMDEAVSCLISRRLQRKLLFTFDQEQCTEAMFKCLDNKFKPIFLKDLNYVFQSPMTKSAKQSYSASNTLLIESDEQLFLFPYEYTADKVSDNELAAGGKLRKYLDELAVADDVPSLVKELPSGKPAISPTHPDWSFYSKIVDVYDGKK